jgi:hypothetical protein
MNKKPSHIKHFLKSRSPEMLKAMMLKNSVEKRHYFDYFIVHDGQFWFAWYEWDTDYTTDVNDEIISEGP